SLLPRFARCISWLLISVHLCLAAPCQGACCFNRRSIHRRGVLSRHRFGHLAQDRSKVRGHPCRFRGLRSSPFFQGTGTDIRDRNVDLELEFDCLFVWTSWGPDDAGVRLCDVISFRLHSRGGACAYPFVMAADWLARRIDFRERRFQLADASANSRVPMAGKRSSRWNCVAGRRENNVDNNENLAAILSLFTSFYHL